MGEFSLSHLLVVGIVLLIFFRKDQLPNLGKSIGKAIRGFKEGLSEIDVEAKDIQDDAHRQIPNPSVKKESDADSSMNRQSKDPVSEKSAADSTKKSDSH